MTAPSFRSAGTLSSFGSADGVVAVAKPAGTAEGDLMLLVWGFCYTNVSPSAPSYPSGWTTLVEYLGTSANAGLALSYKVAGASEGSSYSIQQGTAAAGADRAKILSFSGIDTSTPIDVYSSLTTQDATTAPAAPSISTLGADRLLITAAIEYSGANRTITPAGSMADRWQWTSVPSLDIADETVASSGATGTRTFSSSSTGYFKTFSFALRPLGGSSGLVSLGSSPLLRSRVLRSSLLG